jgi:aspartate/methionine/tyrosine aminotransferase
MDLTRKSADELAAHARELGSAYQSQRGRNLAIDMTRGKPSPEQLDLADGMFSAIAPGDCIGEGGVDYRNYGGIEGIPEARRFFAEYMGVTADEVVVGGNSSLTMMYDVLAGGMLFGMPGGEGPWKDQDKVKFLCPVPGYDRHFAICERLGIEMIPVPMTDAGPDMDAVEAAVADDAAIKGIWCVPKYSNPTGATYSDDTISRLSKMNCKAHDFRVLWDNAYAVHHLGSGPVAVGNLLRESQKNGNPDRVLMFGSTSKITLAGSGVGVLAASETNIADALKKASFASIGPDKINQLRHVRFFGDMDGLLAHMDRLAALIKPKFEAVEEVLENRLAGKGIAEWTKPQGGYFVSVDIVDGCAAEVVRRAGDAGVKLTPAGASFPYGNDPRDRNIRLAPTMPSVDEIRQAMDVFCTCVEWVCAERLSDTA